MAEKSLVKEDGARLAAGALVVAPPPAAVVADVDFDDELQAATTSAAPRTTAVRAASFREMSMCSPLIEVEAKDGPVNKV
jgi:hypothetical protein